MKKKVLVAALLSSFAVASAQEVENPILKKLVEKGILSAEEAAQIDEQLANEEAEKAKYEAEIDKRAMEATEKIKKLDKKFANIPTIAGAFKKIKFEGLDYIGYTYTSRKKQYTGKNDSGDFELRRAYFTTMAYLNDKDYARLTLDVSNDYNSKPDSNNNNYLKADNTQSIKMKVKYAYLYKDISDIIPFTGFEVGIVHTPWIDYEEHSGWLYRSVDKTFYESGDGAGMLPSADAGLEFKTKTPYITAEYGVFNGEGYDKINTSSSKSSGFHNSLEGRLTYHIFGNGDKKLKPEKDTYANISLHLMSDFGYNDYYTSHNNLNAYHIHAVYNNPMFLIAAQYLKTDYNNKDAKMGDGYSVNAEVRPIQDWSVFARYDHWEPEKKQGTATAYWDKRDVYYAGVAWSMNKYIKWIANVAYADYKGANDPAKADKSADYKDYTKYMITAEVKW
ncbi:hypothetical protein JCM14244_14880 [Venenivibrio stagnispumantis]|uniref:Phosphate-selective porin O and P n=1 Tax=Venenivibrio stagnispumantis TaxID=407998 RepID=A0AA45WJ15_9AQUI|nr:hypothetical protein [Venenivibrio stagnispumantis]MCW4572532.1 hypothetical protein [Venenivibrio stagnispumantis]SMP01739.1 hypothetical protein SAMN06264868_10221 [Venenivibrio stagnispumantis]